MQSSYIIFKPFVKNKLVNQRKENDYVKELFQL